MDNPTFKAVDRLQGDIFIVINHLSPFTAFRGVPIIDRVELEVDGIVIHQNEKVIALMIHRIFEPVHSGGNALEFPSIFIGRIGVEVVHLIGDGTANVQNHKLVIARPLDGNPKFGVILLKHQRVTLWLLAHFVFPELVRTPGIVKLDVEHSLIIIAPRHRPGDILNFIRKQLTGLQVFKHQIVIFISFLVCAVRQDLKVR